MTCFLRTLPALSVEVLSLDNPIFFNINALPWMACLTERDLMLISRDGEFRTVWGRGCVEPVLGDLKYRTYLQEQGFLYVRELYRNESPLAAALPASLYLDTGDFYGGGICYQGEFFRGYNPATYPLVLCEYLFPHFRSYQYLILRYDDSSARYAVDPLHHLSLPPSFRCYPDPNQLLNRCWLPCFFSATSIPMMCDFIVQSYDFGRVRYLPLGVRYLTTDDRLQRAILCVSYFSHDAYFLDLSPVEGQLDLPAVSPVTGVLWIGRFRTYLFLAVSSPTAKGESVGFQCHTLYRIEFPTLICSPAPS